MISKMSSLLRRTRATRGAPEVEGPEVLDFEQTITAADHEIIARALPLSITSLPRVQAVIDAVRYCEARRVPGAFAECGVWRGGSVLAMILSLQQLGVTDRDIYLYDTFEGMVEPTEADTTPFGASATEIWDAAQGSDHKPWPEYFNEDFNEDVVRETLLATGYPEKRLHFVKGRVEDTIPNVAPPEIALLRLDTDWYESTRHELIHLYPRVSPGGVLIIDDYGHWEGSARAVDEYLTEHVPLLLSRIDYSGRMAVKH